MLQEVLRDLQVLANRVEHHRHYLDQVKIDQ